MFAPPPDLGSRNATTKVCERDNDNDDDDNEIAYFSVHWKTREWDHNSETKTIYTVSQKRPPFYFSNSSLIN